VIQTDDAGGVRAAVTHLIDSGYRRIAYVESGVRDSNTIRAETVSATLRSRGIDAPLQRFMASVDAWRSPAHLAAQIAADLPDALVCYDDQLALGLMNALRDLGIQVPDDVGIVGFDGIPYAAMSNPRLTTVAVPSAEMGRVAAASLIRAVHDGVLPEGVLLPVGIVVRESTRAVVIPARR
jgi:LacI family transcriptional regulator